MSPDQQVQRFAKWVAATAELFALELAEPQSDAILDYLVRAYVQRERVFVLRENRDWELADYREAEVMAVPIASLLYVGLRTYFGEEPFDLREYRAVKSYLLRAAHSG